MESKGIKFDLIKSEVQVISEGLAYQDSTVCVYNLHD